MDNKATYAITALRYTGPQITEAMMGLIDGATERWDMFPAPTRLTEVVDRLVEGDTIVALFPQADGRLQGGSEILVDVLAEGTETLALADESPGRRIADLPRF